MLRVQNSDSILSIAGMQHYIKINMNAYHCVSNLWDEVRHMASS
jgi:hypothetical protein